MSEHREIRGTHVPCVGFGTFKITGPDCVHAVRDALEVGYRHIDTARVYHNESEVGQAVRESGIPREEVFVTTKVWFDELEPATLRRAAEESRARLGLDHIDLLLIHWPNEAVPIDRTLAAMAELRDAGQVREFGVSNFPPRLLREALEHQPLFADQVEFHPFLGQDGLESIAADNDMLVIAYAPLAAGRAADDETLQRVAQAHGKTPGQVALRWLLDKPRTAVIPKTTSHERRIENLDVFDFGLSAEETAAIDALPKDQRYFQPGWAPAWD